MTALVVTTISQPNDVLRALASGSQQHGWQFYVVGDEKTPADFSLDGAEYLSVGHPFAAIYPRNHYARKNAGYVAAMRAGADVIVETDDDNMPLPSFWQERSVSRILPVVRNSGWVNVYRYFVDHGPAWPRGFPLSQDSRTQKVHEADRPDHSESAYCPIQQGLSEGDMDLDAIHRLVIRKRPVAYRGGTLALSQSWCPFNSQNTTWAREAFPLLYLPSYCSFRMTDIWRSFIAQRIAYARGWSILWHGATVHQERNAHDLMQDFEQEIPGYLHNLKIRETLERVELSSDLLHGLRQCYWALTKTGIMDEREMPLLEAWIGEFR